MPFTATADILASLEALLKGLPLDPAQPVASGGSPLFSRVALFGTAQLTAAMRGVFASEARICYIVPAGDDYEHTPDTVRQLLASTRATRVVLLIADRACASDSTAALVGPGSTTGVLPLKDRVVAELIACAAKGQVYIPENGVPIVISDADKPANNLGRECWSQPFLIPAGQVRQFVG